MSLRVQTSVIQQYSRLDLCILNSLVLKVQSTCLQNTISAVSSQSPNWCLDFNQAFSLKNLFFSQLYIINLLVSWGHRVLRARILLQGPKYLSWKFVGFAAKVKHQIDLTINIFFSRKSFSIFEILTVNRRSSWAR